MDFFTLHFVLYRLNWKIDRKYAFICATFLLIIAGVFSFTNMRGGAVSFERISSLLFFLFLALLINGFLGLIITILEFLRHMKTYAAQKHTVFRLRKLVTEFQTYRKESGFLDEDEKKENYGTRNRLCNLFNGGIGSIGFSIIPLFIIFLYMGYERFIAPFVFTKITTPIQLFFMVFLSLICINYLILSVFSNCINIYNYLTRYSPKEENS